MKQTIEYSPDPRWHVELDSNEIVADDPGQGTPAMVYFGQKASGTFWRALETGELSTASADMEIPKSVQSWLEEIEEEVSAFLDEHTPATAPTAPGLRA